MGKDFDPFELMKYFWVLAYAAIIGIAYLIGKLTLRKRMNKLRAVAPYLGARTVTGFLGPRLEGIKGGRKFKVQIVSGGKNAPPVLRLSMETFLPGSFAIYRPDLLTGLMEKFVKRAPTGDRSFDTDFFSTSPDPVSFASFFSDARRLAAARRLLDRGYQRIESKKGMVSANLPSNDMDSELETAKITGALDDLAELSS